MSGLLAVGVGDHPPRVVADHRRVEVAARREVEQRRGEQHRPIVGRQPGAGEVDETVGVSCDHDRGLRRRRLHEGGGIEVPGGDDGERLGDVGVGERSLVEQGDDRVVGDRGTGEVGVAECGDEIGPQRTGAGEQVALVFEVVAHDDRVHAESSGDRRERLGFEPSLGEAALERVQQVGGGGAALQHDVASEVGALDDAGQHRVDGAAPPVVREVGGGDLPHPATARRVTGRVEPLGEFGLVLGQLGIAQSDDESEFAVNHGNSWITTSPISAAGAARPRRSGAECDRSAA